jgi:hypothetical protein
MSLTAKSAYPYNAGKLYAPASCLSESGHMDVFLTSELSFQKDGTDCDIRLQCSLNVQNITEGNVCFLSK